MCLIIWRHYHNHKNKQPTLLQHFYYFTGLRAQFSSYSFYKATHLINEWFMCICIFLNHCVIKILENLVISADFFVFWNDSLCFKGRMTYSQTRSSTQTFLSRLARLTLITKKNRKNGAVSHRAAADLLCPASILGGERVNVMVHIKWHKIVQRYTRWCWMCRVSIPDSETYF